MSAGVVGEKFCLRWNDFESNISRAFRELRDDKDFFDVTLACEDNQLQAHKVILSACSPFFRTVLKRNPHPHPLLFLKGVGYESLLAVLNFMYHGEVNVAQEDLNKFLAVAEELQVKGLTQNDPNNKVIPAQSAPPSPSPPPAPKRYATEPIQSVAPPPKVARVRHHESHQVEYNSGALQPVIETRIKTEVPVLVDCEEEEEAVGEYQGGQMYEYQGGYDGGNQGVYGVDQGGGHQGDMENSADDPGNAVDNKIQDEKDSFQLNQVANAEADLEELNNTISSSMEKINGTWSCLRCGKTAEKKSTVVNHIEAKHIDGITHPCPICQKQFRSRNYLSKHMCMYHRA